MSAESDFSLLNPNTRDLLILVSPPTAPVPVFSPRHVSNARNDDFFYSDRRTRMISTLANQPSATGALHGVCVRAIT